MVRRFEWAKWETDSQHEKRQMTGVTVRELTPDLVDDHLHFFAEDAFTDNPDWSGCYCYFHHFTGTSEEWQQRSATANREAIQELIRADEFHGLLAYRKDEPIGWCKAVIRAELPDPDRVGPPVDESFDQVGVILCFLVSPSHRRRGVAGQLLDAACRSLAQRGASVIEGYPLKNTETSAEQYHGPLSLYEDAGFALVMEEADGPRTVMRKSL